MSWPYEQLDDIEASQMNFFTSDDAQDLTLSPGSSRRIPSHVAELRSRSSNHSSSSSVDAKYGNTVLLEKKLQNGDSLQKLALKYQISVSDLKRLNGLMSDQDFYALRVLKVPMKKYVCVEAQTSSEQPGTLPCSLNSPAGVSHISSVFQDMNSSGHGPAAPEDGVGETIADLFLDVDKNLEKAKKTQEMLANQSRTQELSDDGSGYVGDLGQLETRSSLYRQKWLTRNVFHFVLVTLLIFLIFLLPLSWILYKLLIE